MSACELCLARSIARAGAIEQLEDSGLGSKPSREQLEQVVGLAAGSGSEEYRATPESLGGREVWAVCRHDPEYPQALLNFRRPGDVPHVLYGIGEKRHFDALPKRPGVAIVGARRATSYGREAAYSLASECAAAGLTVVSGMALGVDGAAHRGALQAHSPTIAVLAGGPDRAYPRSHRLLYEQILEFGCVISEAPPGVEAMRWGFVARNRIIAGVAGLTIFVEGSQTSGACHTVAFAEELDLPIAAVPGPIFSPMSAGPNALLADEGVAVIRGVDDVLAVLGVDRPSSAEVPKSPSGPEGLADRILRQIACGDRDPRALAASLQDLTGREISSTLGQLELAGRIRRSATGGYELVERLR